MQSRCSVTAELQASPKAAESPVPFVENSSLSHKGVSRRDPEEQAASRFVREERKETTSDKGKLEYPEAFMIATGLVLCQL